MTYRYSDKVYYGWIRIIKIIFWVIFFACIFLTFSFQIWLELDDTFFQKREIEYYQGWKYVKQEALEEITIPTQVEAKRGESVYLQNVLPSKIPEGYKLYICGTHQDMVVRIDGEIVASYDGRVTRLFGTSAPSYYLTVDLQQDDASKKIEVEYYTMISRKSGSIGDIVYGSETGFIYYIIKRYANTLLTAALLFIIGMCFIFFSLVTNVIFGKKQGFHYLGAFPMMIGLIIFSGSYVRQFYMTNLSAMNILTYTGIDLCAIPLLCFLDELQQYRYKQFYIHMKTAYLVCYVIALFLHVFQIKDFASTILGFHVLICVSMVVVCGLFIYDLHKNKRPEIVESFVALCFSGLFILIEILQVDIKNVSIWGSYMTIGVLIFLIIMSFTAMSQMQRREHENFKAIEASEAKTAFLANVSHEIRTPLNVMLGMNEMILRESNSEELTGYAESIHESGRSLLYLINNILDMTKIESGKMEIVYAEFDLRTFLDNLNNIGKERSYKNKNTFLIQASGELPVKLIADEQRIRQIVINFISNASKYTKNGEIKLCVELASSVRTDPLMLKLSVVDTGMGIKEEDQQRLFEHFTRMDLVKNRKVEGTGLGLSISKELADLMQATIGVESEYGKGSCFSLTVPVKLPEEEQETLGEYAPNKALGHQKIVEHGFIAPEATVLAVDDNHMNLEVIKSLLKRTGMEIDVAESGKDCLDLITKKKYDIILLDHMMPEMDGVETIQQAKTLEGNLNRDTPYIAVTANAVMGAKQMLIQNGFTDFVSKPIVWKDLENTIQRYLPKHLIVESVMNSKQPEFTEEELLSYEVLLHKYDIQMQEGLRYTGEDIFQYAKFLELFYHSYPKIREELVSNLEKENIEYYTVKVHALKGNAKSMGALDLFYTAQRMEKRGKHKDTDYLIKAQHLLLLEMERAYQGAEEFLNVTKLWEEDRREDRQLNITLSEEQLKEVFEHLSDYIEDFQSGEAIRLIKETRSYQLDETVDKLLIDLEHLLDDMEYEQAEELLEKT